MNSRTTTRAVVLVASLFCLVMAGFAAVAPPASAEGEVTVTWPEITAFNPDTTDYVVDVEWDGAGSLWLVYAWPGIRAQDEIVGPGSVTVDFPVRDDGGPRGLVVVSCPATGFHGGCTEVSRSPVLDITRSAVEPGTPGDVSVVWPDVRGFNPDTDRYEAQISWDGRGSLFVFASDGDDYVRYDEIHEAGPYPLRTELTGPGASLEVGWVACPGKVLEWTGCTYGQSEEVGAWRAFDIAVEPGRTGPDRPFLAQILPAVDEPLQLVWQLLDDGTIVAEDSSTIQQGQPGPALGDQPQLVEGRTYELQVQVAGETATYGELAGTGSASITWDTEVDADVASGVCCQRDGTVPSDVFYPEVDGYYDHMTWQVPASAEAHELDVTIRGVGGGAVRELAAVPGGSRLEIAWDGRGEDGELVAAGDYLAEAVVRDEAGNVAVSSQTIRVSRESIVSKVWRATVAADDLRVGRERKHCGRLVSPARRAWPGSVGYYTPERCAGSRYYEVGTRHQIEVPEEFRSASGVPRTFTNQPVIFRVTVVGGKAPSERRSTLDLRYYNRFGAVQTQRTLDGRTGQHPGPWIEDQIHQREGESGWFLTWGVRARQGSQYDVRRFIVEVEYDVLE